MPSIFSLIGNEPVRDFFGTEPERIAGSFFVFYGPESVGKSTLARVIASREHCQKTLAMPCQECVGCVMIKNHAHPDHWEGKPDGTLVVDDIRELRAWSRWQPAMGSTRTAVVSDADRMTPEAQNALLKFLEDGPASVTVFFTTSNVDRLLPTIRSRARLMRFYRVPQAQLSEAMTQQFSDIDSRRRISAVQMSNGAPGKAIQWLSNPQAFDHVLNDVNHLTKIFTHPHDAFLWIHQQFQRMAYADQERRSWELLQRFSWIIHCRICDQGPQKSDVHRALLLSKKLAVIIRNRFQHLQPGLVWDMLLSSDQIYV